MKFLSLLFFSTFLYSQIGVNTKNPQQIFHIDGKYSDETSNQDSDNLSEIQQSDDFVVTNDARVGVGTTNPQGALELVSTTKGLLIPRLTSSQRDELEENFRPKGTLIFNKERNLFQYNSGDEVNPIWSNLEANSSTINTLSYFEKKITQTINTTTTPGTILTFSDASFSNIPFGFVQKTSTSTFKLTKGKNYKIDFKSGSVLGSGSGSSMCSLVNITSNTVLAMSRNYPTTFLDGNNNVSGDTSFIAIVSPEVDSEISINCASGSSASGTKTWYQNDGKGAYANPPASLLIQILN